jgi:hypothetical protein
LFYYSLFLFLNLSGHTGATDCDSFRALDHLLSQCVDSKLQSALSSGVCQRFDPTVVPKSRPVEGDRFDTCGKRFFGDPLPNEGRRRNVAAVMDAGLNLSFKGRCARQHLASRSVDHLGVDMPWSSEDVHARSTVAGDPRPCFPAAPNA